MLGASMRIQVVGLRRRQAATKVSEEAALIAVAEPAPAAVLGATGGAAWLADMMAVCKSS